jgi:ABC-type transporter Mla subunit MlaD
MKVTAAAKVGFTAVVIVLVMMSIYKGLGWRIPGFTGPGFKTYTVHVNFTSVKGLNPGAKVQLNGNNVGEVGDITNDGFGGVQVALEIKDTQPIHEHAKFIIVRDSIFGSFLVSIQEARSGNIVGHMQGNQATIRIVAGTAGPDQLIIRENETIGQVVDVESHDIRSDLIMVDMFNGFVIDETMAFVPERVTSGESGLRVYYKLGPDVIVDGSREPGPEDLIADADIALVEITRQATELMEKLSDLLDNVQDLLGPDDIRNLINDLSAEAKLISSNIITLTDRLNVMLADAQPHIESTFENIEGLTLEARDLMEGIAEYNDPEFRGSIEGIITNLETASSQLVEILDDIEQFTSDDELRENIIATVAEARGTLDLARNTLDSTSDAIDDAVETMDYISSIETGAEFRIRHAPGLDRWAGDINVRVGMEGEDAFIIGGIDDLGETDRSNARIGFWLNDESSAMAGIYHGKIGLGLDWREKAYRFVTELYDPNDLKWDIYAGYAILPELDLMIGIEDIIDDDEVNLALSYKF